MPKNTPRPDAALREQHPRINEGWFKAQLLAAAPPERKNDYHRWASEREQLDVDPSVLTRRLKGRKAWPVSFAVRMTHVLKLPLSTILGHLGEGQPYDASVLPDGGAPVAMKRHLKARLAIPPWRRTKEE